MREQIPQKNIFSSIREYKRTYANFIQFKRIYRTQYANNTRTHAAITRTMSEPAPGSRSLPGRIACRRPVQFLSDGHRQPCDFPHLWHPGFHKFYLIFFLPILRDPSGSFAKLPCPRRRAVRRSIPGVRPSPGAATSHFSQIALNPPPPSERNAPALLVDGLVSNSSQDR
jgi:hypothetical protein